MSEFEPTEYANTEEHVARVAADEPTVESVESGVPTVESAPPGRRKRWPFVVATVVVVLAAAGVGFYFLGAPSQDQAVSESGLEVPPADPSSPLAIEIPGCVCHSDDPKVVARHKEYRMNQCMGCHKDGTPAMGAQ